MESKLSEELTWRGFVNQTTFKSVHELDELPLTFYFGVDPSAPSMTIGNLAAMMMVRKFIQHGHIPVLLIGGATGLIGDPDGKAQERDLKDESEVNANKAKIIAQYKKILGGMEFKVVDNYDWFKDINYLEFLRDIGKHVPMRQMMGREFVQSRLSDEGAGISYAEFSYVLIQAYDFLHLSREFGVTLQICGADQWGNSVAGVDLIRRIDAREAHVWSTPLIFNKATGKKFGKSEEGAVWLDPELTSPYKFYQFWLNVDDDGVEDYLKVYTELGPEELNEVMNDFEDRRQNRRAQKELAYEVTKLVHGAKTAEDVKKISEVMFGSDDYNSLTKKDFELLKAELPVVDARVSNDLVEILVAGKLASSKGEARRFLLGNAIYINGLQIPLEKTFVDDDDVIAGHVVVRRGKNASVIVEM